MPEATRKCHKCGVYRPLEDFYRTTPDHRSKTRPCRHCTRAYATERTRRQTAYIQKIKLERGCDDCGLKIDIPEVYDFDHRPGVVKVGDVSKLRLGDMGVLKAEIAKCDVVCANCHRIRTVTRGDHGRPFGSSTVGPGELPGPEDPLALFDLQA